MKKNLIIGITDCEKWENYAGWISGNDSNIKPILLTYREKATIPPDKCDGLVLTGGKDVHPKFYNKPAYIKIKKHNINVDEKRDEFERKIIDLFLEQGKPILGICRGLQLLNVHFGGILIPDLPAFHKEGHSKINGNDNLHKIKISHGTLLFDIAGVTSSTVNSAHHQAADEIAKEFTLSAISENGVVEALEWKNPRGKSWLLAVQWHPERMGEKENPCAKNIRIAFLKECRINYNS
ncbi:MAG: gamma-glutamyl-gamma-aminobutyrate hydrolase family protein [Bacteroidetes bacterium]|nr:gamma-glutamyl-gamma-aminobutyrate hydrolase family protein [Bacteroidota bacterium]